MIHFELIFMKGLLYVSRFFFYSACGCLVMPGPFIEKAILSSLIFACFFVKRHLIR